MASLTMKTRQNLAKEDSALVRQMRQIMAKPRGPKKGGSKYQGKGIIYLSLLYEAKNAPSLSP